MQEALIKEKSSNGSLLTPSQKETYQRDGFLVIKNFIPIDICHLLMKRACELIEGFDPADIKIIFSPHDESHAMSLYFLDSGDKIRFFLEKEAIDETGELKSDRQLCINKIGHALHDLDPTFNCFSRQHKIALLAQDLGIVSPLLVQSMYLCKQPYIGDEVTCHQDATYLYTKEQPVTGLWFALEDATIENGCLWAIPGGHKTPLKSRMIRDKNDRVSTEIYDNSAWTLEKMVPLETPAGSVIVLHGLLPHMSKENLSPRSRHAYSLHLISSRSEYPANNWLQRPKNMPFKGFVF